MFAVLLLLTRYIYVLYALLFGYVVQLRNLESIEATARLNYSTIGLLLSFNHSYYHDIIRYSNVSVDKYEKSEMITICTIEQTSEKLL